MRRIAALSLGLVVVAAAASAHSGEPLPTRADNVFTPGRNAATDDTSDSLVTNPANLANMPSWEARATYARCTDDSSANGCGYSFAFATPLFWNLATGLRFDLVQPSWGDGPAVGVTQPYRQDYDFLAWGLATKLGDRLAFGMSIRRSYSLSSAFNDLFGVTAGLTYRPNKVLALAAVAHDFNATVEPGAIGALDQSYSLAGALRPTGTRAFEVGLELKYLQGTQQWVDKVTAGLDVPGVGRLRGDIQIAHLPNDDRRGVMASLGLDVAFDHVVAGGGAVFGNGLGTATSLAEYGSLAVQGWREPGVPRAQRAVYFRIEKTPDVREHVKLLRQLWKIADDKEIASITLVLRAEPADSYAHAEELADALRVLRAHGKKSLCSFEDNGGKSLYVCANADRIVVNPAGGIRYAGHSSSFMYLAGLLKKIGVRADIVRVSDHKSAPEELTNEAPSDTARADHQDVLANVDAVFTKNLAVGRHLSEAQVREATRNGPFVASEAKNAGFVDGFAFDDELERVTRELDGANIRYEKYEDDLDAPQTFGGADKLGLLYIEGDIIDGRSTTVPFLGIKTVGSYSIVDAVKQLQDDPAIRAVVLRVESPGGSSMASDVMWRQLLILSQRKPLIVSMGSVAASGGYYVAMAGKLIYALPLTVTGSIGVFYGKADLSELLKKIGVNIETYRTAPRADAESMYRPYTDEERKELQHKISQFYDTFLDRVSQGRHMTKAEVDTVGEGRVWMGQEALQRKLVDRMGGLREAIEKARELGGLSYDSPIVALPNPESTFVEKALKLVLGGESAQAQSITEAAVPRQVRTILRAVAPLTLYESRTPLSRLEWVTTDEDDSN
jgi:protease-4